jgi:signal transduction histidine kinase/ActR/RegA family two-component response regulator
MDIPLGSITTLSDEDRLQHAIDKLVAEVRTNGSGSEAAAALKNLVSQLRNANQNLVLAAVKAQVLQEEAETLNRRQNEFLAMLAHELRNPMAPIGNAAKLLERVVAAHPLLPQIQGVISRQVDHMAHLLDDLLDASRITSGKVNLQKSMIALNDVLMHSVEISRPFIEKRQQQLEIESISGSMLIDGDLDRLAQVFSNLLINASKFTHERGRILLSARRQAESVIVSVKDNGRGIEPELQPVIFDLFMQGPRSLDRSEGGLGIGLSVARGLVDMHDGKISVRSAGQGLGSEFEVTLPLAGARERNQSINPLALKQPAASCKRILLIEDNADANATLKLLLELEGHQVTSALDGLTGLSLAKAHAYDFIICDIGLPGLDGYEVMTQIRQQLDQPRPYAIALSGYGQPEDRARAVDAGFDHYLLKPVKGDFLLHVISSVSQPLR